MSVEANPSILESMQTAVERIEAIRTVFDELRTVKQAMESTVDVEEELRSFFEEFDTSLPISERIVRGVLSKRTCWDKVFSQVSSAAYLDDNRDKLISAEARLWQEDPSITRFIGETFTIKPTEAGNHGPRRPWVGFGEADTIFDYDSSISGKITGVSVLGRHIDNNAGFVALEAVEYSLISPSRREHGHSATGYVRNLFRIDDDRTPSLVTPLVTIETAVLAR